MDRYTRKDVDAIFERYVKMIGGRIATRYDDVGGYRLDHAGVYGGYNVEQIMNESGGISQPFGARRHRPTEFVTLLFFAMDTLRESERNKETANA